MGGRILRVVPPVVLVLLAIINLGRGSIHAFAADGGAHSIAGLDLSTNRQTILSLFAITGFQQIVTGLFEMFVLFFRRDLVAIALGFQTAQTVAGVVNLYWYRTFPVDVPGAPFNALLTVVLVFAFVMALMQKAGNE